MNTKVLTGLILFFALSAVNVYSQDMDAGISILGRRDPLLLKESDNSKFTISNKVGFSGKDPFAGGQYTYNTITAEGDFHIYKTTRVIFAVPYGFSAGPAETTRGFGDMILLCTSTIPIPGIGAWDLSLGAKFSSGSADLSIRPMAYQPGTGTNDLLIGFGRSFGMANIYIGYQKPFDRSNNSYTFIKRGDDLMFRFGITQPFEKAYLQAEILGIKRIQKSNVLVHGSNPQQYIDIDGSNEFQLNVMGKVGFKTSENIGIEALAALPLLTRTSNIDGLKRVFTISASAFIWFDLN